MAYFPVTDVPPNGSGQRLPAGRGTRLRGLPRRRRPIMMALSVALAGAGVVVSAAVYQQADHRRAVVVITSAVPAGAVISSTELGTAEITVPAGIRVIPVSQLSDVTGLIAAETLLPGTLLAPADLATSQPPRPGQVLVALPVKPESLPASGLAPGDHVLVVATPGDQGQSGGGLQVPALSVPAAAVIAAVNMATDEDGFDVVDVLVPAALGQAVAAQASTGQFALIVTKRGA